jgi:enamine deaminase RidA (YjgF/YER057c/UK114 family)
MRKMLLSLLIISIGISIDAISREKEIVPSDGESEKGLCNSLVVRIGHTLYLSGVVGGVGGDMKSQMETVYEIIGLTLKQFKANPADIVSEHVYTTDMNGFKANMGIRSAFYKDHFPASTWVEVRRLVDAGLLVEIEVIAEIP